MTDHVFIVSEWLPKKSYENELWRLFKELMALTLEKEKGCLRAHATRQISHTGSPGKSKYPIVLLQEYVDIQAFDIHCEADYVTNFFKKYIENDVTSIVEDWRCRLTSLFASWGQPLDTDLLSKCFLSTCLGSTS